MELKIIDRITKKEIVEKIYYGKWISFLYSRRYNWLSSIFRLFVTTPFAARWVAKLQENKRSKKKIAPFIKEHKINSSEFEKDVSQFSSFQDFFIRKIRSEARPLSKEPIIFADGRYRVYKNYQKDFWIKGLKYSLKQILLDKSTMEQYAASDMLFARLAPSDCHRFYFPCSAQIKRVIKIGGRLLSVNPIAMERFPNIVWRNSRFMVFLESKHFGELLLVIVGATFVGSIIVTASLEKDYQAGDEMGYFKFGGSAILLFSKGNKISFAPQIVESSQKGLETLCRIGEPLSLDI